ncbi:MAG: Ferredoxin thioredoxin reductase catalytic beta chain [Syntrophorhabdus sp. PtaB.Bin184]|jgi:ferredoxin-thioredoxin reductase catalytic chain|nr:MAG: Ferredoxin thioredoxin reductase catalytic beta chain [Syntrophorhabdus sp. PtaB.Bin184]
MNDGPAQGSKGADLFLEDLLARSQASGYHLNPDMGFVRALVQGLLTNVERYGYPACPCRLASGRREDDSDIICPCDYRDADLAEHGSCFCALYVSRDVAEGHRPLASIPERRPAEGSRRHDSEPVAGIGRPPLPVWRCRVCGYLCAREAPPETCPICKAAEDRFECFLSGGPG